MRSTLLRQTLREPPFEPFRIHLCSGMVHEVRHLEMALPTPHGVHVVQLASSGKVTDRVVKCDLIHAVALESADGRSGRSSRRRRSR